jgi:signal transduction histidine kinase
VNNLRNNHIDRKYLKFFGRVNASISHELKNILAIISETTGFLDDLVKLAHQDGKFDLQILENSTKSIAEEIQRGFHTIRQMNNFAHSVDENEKELDAAESIQLAVNLTRFLSTAKPVVIQEAEQPVHVTVNPFLFVILLYSMLCQLFTNTQADQIQVRFNLDETDRVEIIFSHDDAGSMEPVPEDINYILEKLDISMIVNHNPFEIRLQMSSK